MASSVAALKWEQWVMFYTYLLKVGDYYSYYQYQLLKKTKLLLNTMHPGFYNHPFLQELCLNYNNRTTLELKLLVKLTRISSNFHSAQQELISVIQFK